MAGNQLISSKELENYRHKLKNLMKHINNNERASHQQIAGSIPALMALYDNIANVLKNPKPGGLLTIITDLEDAIIKYVLENGDCEARLEKECAKFL